MFVEVSSFPPSPPFHDILRIRNFHLFPLVLGRGCELAIGCLGMGEEK
jgi:hypothetical protein